MATSSGCPKCGADRLKSAPFPVVDTLVTLVSLRRRYRCSACGWAGRRHRLKRRNQELSSLTPQTVPAKRAIWLFLVVVAFLIVSGTMAMRGCRFEVPTATIGWTT